jgi:hypothetical protein
LDLDIANTAWIIELKKKEGEEPFHPVARVGKASHGKVWKKDLKKMEEDKAPQPAVMPTKTALNNMRKARGHT